MQSPIQPDHPEASIETMLLYSRHYARKYVWPKHVQEDFVQEVAKALSQKLASFDPTRGRFSTWVFSHCGYQWLHMLRDRRKENLTRLGLAFQFLTEAERRAQEDVTGMVMQLSPSSFPTTVKSPAEECLAKEDQQEKDDLIKKVMHPMTDLEREIVIKRIGGDNSAKVAESLGVAVTSVYKAWQHFKMNAAKALQKSAQERSREKHLHAARPSTEQLKQFVLTMADEMKSRGEKGIGAKIARGLSVRLNTPISARTVTDILRAAKGVRPTLVNL